MHLLWENVVKNLMSLWAGKYKDLDEGEGSYHIPPAVWDEIGRAGIASGDLIPYVFGPKPPNVASDKISWTADTRAFWTLYVAPVVLRGRFIHDKYYDHFLDLVKLLHMCLQFEITDDEIEMVRTGFISWVQKYEDYYYQHRPERLSAAPLTIHALLHIAESIRLAGPVWASWAFPMERYCGRLVPAIRSRRHPYSGLNRYVLDAARLTHIKLLYPGLRSILRLAPEIVERGLAIPNYDTCVLLPAKQPFVPERGLLDKLLGCLCTRLTATPAAVRAALPRELQQWGKVRILNGGDTIRAADITAVTEDGRDASHVRYELLVDKNARYRNRPVILEKKTFYGQLRQILVINLGPVPSASPPQSEPSTLVLGVIRRCIIESDHRALDIHYYRRHGALEIVDITTIQCLVGRVQDRGHYGVIDRSGALARAIYIEEAE
ncbi:hypothetical protein BV20DRAFT_1036311 [Pilatotrama ljubarskyi]|nr:hypothetical protein BV20DRAFT_1036311 [Pilatotrama ljubarskyi]